MDYALGTEVDLVPDEGEGRCSLFSIRNRPKPALTSSEVLLRSKYIERSLVALSTMLSKYLRILKRFTNQFERAMSQYRMKFGSLPLESHFIMQWQKVE